METKIHSTELEVPSSRQESRPRFRGSRTRTRRIAVAPDDSNGSENEESVSTLSSRNSTRRYLDIQRENDFIAYPFSKLRGRRAGSNSRRAHARTSREERVNKRAPASGNWKPLRFRQKEKQIPTGVFGRTARNRVNHAGSKLYFVRLFPPPFRELCAFRGNEHFEYSQGSASPQ